MKPIRSRSQAAFQRAGRLIPGGVNSPARAFGGVGGEPPFIERGEGPYLFDLDGNRYLDFVGSWGPLILGHAHPRVVAAVEAALRKGASFGAPTELETPHAEFLDELRRLTLHYGALLIYDEVMTGFRLALGGAQELYQQQPDLTVLGKIVGGGLPVGAYGGRADIMAKVMPAGPVFQAGTLSGNPLAMAAGIATLRELKQRPPYQRLEVLSRRLSDGLDKAATKAGLAHQLQRV